MKRKDRITKKRGHKVQPRFIYEMEVELIGGPVTEEFLAKNPRVLRTIDILGDQTLECLHDVIFEAFNREDEHMYEFQIGGKEPQDRNARRYTMPEAMDDVYDDIKRNDTTGTTIELLGLNIGESFYYWFDFGDDWWHEITVKAITKGRVDDCYPKVTQSTGESPPQYPDWDGCDEDEDFDGDENEPE